VIYYGYFCFVVLVCSRILLTVFHYKMYNCCFRENADWNVKGSAVFLQIFQFPSSGLMSLRSFSNSYLGFAVGGESEMKP
jgi:hypothetical protein